MSIVTKRFSRVSTCFATLLFPLMALFALFGFGETAMASNDSPTLTAPRLLTTAVDCSTTTWVVTDTTTLNEAIGCFNGLASGTGVITVAADVTLVTTSTQITNNSAVLSLFGNGHTIDGNGAYRVLHIAGGVAAIEGITLTNGLLTDANGAGLRVDSGGLFTLTNSTVMNSAARSGGGIAISGAHGRIEQSLIFNNEAHRFSGGGVIVGGDAQVVIAESRIVSNTAQARGGGMRINNEGTAITITQSTIRDNLALIEGGGVYANDGRLTLINSTVSGNHSVDSGGGVFGNGVVAFVYSSIVSNTAENGSGGGISVTSGTMMTLEGTLLAYNSGDDCGGSLTDSGYNLSSDSSCPLTGTGSMTMTDPLLLPLADNGGETSTHAFGVDSPAVNAAGSGTVSTDQRGESRPQGVANDIGAYELVCGASQWEVDSTTSLNFAIDCFNQEPEGTHAISFTDSITLSEATTSIDNSNASLEIQGNGHMIDGSSAYRPFHIDHGDVTIDSLTIMNGFAASSGGAGIFVENDSTLTLLNSDVAYSDAGNGFGGGVRFNDNSQGIIENSSFYSNTSRSGGGIYISSDEVTIENSVIYGNESSQNGGGLSINRGVLRLVNSTISGNDGANADGFATDATAATVYLTHTTVVSNGDQNIRIAGSGESITGSVAFVNSLVAGSNNNCIFGGDAETTAVFASYSLSDDTTCFAGGADGNIVSTNIGIEPLQDNGGETWSHAFQEGSPAVNAIPAGTNGCGTTYTTDQRGFSRPWSASGCTIGAVEYDEALAVTAVGDVYSVVQLSSLVVDSSEGVLANDVVNVAVGLTATLVTTPDYGTVALASDGAFTYTHTGLLTGTDVFTYQVSAGTVTDTGRVTITINERRCFVDNDHDPLSPYVSEDASALQTAVDNATAGDSLKIAGTCTGVSTVSGNDQTVYVSKSLTLTGGYSSTTWTQTGEVTTLDAADGGRVVYISDAISVTLENLTVANGRGTGDGGAIYLRDNATLTLSESIVEHNDATGDGGGIYGDGGNDIRIENSTIMSNSASSNGGGIYGDGGEIHIENSTMVNNSTFGDGGGIYGNNGTVTLANTTLISNSTRLHDGGGVYGFESDIHIENSTIMSNSANDEGGGIYGDGGEIYIENSTISGNSVADKGGGIYLVSGATAYLTHTTVVSNSGLLSPFGVYNDNRVFDDGAVYVTGGLIAHNSGGDCTGSITDGGYNLSSDNSCSFTQTTSLTNTNPLLLPLADNGGETWTHAFQEGSPAVDAIPAGANGCGTTYTQDQIGTTRPHNGSCDIGAYELLTDCPSGIYPVATQSKLDSAIVCYNAFIAGTMGISLTADIVLTAALTTIDNNHGTTLHVEGLGHSLDGDNSQRLFDISSGIVTMNQLTLTHGIAADKGGGAVYLGSSGVLTMTESRVINNISYASGGGIYLQSGSTLTLKSSEVATNTAEFSRGGGLHIGNDAIGIIENSAIYNNESPGGNGGGVSIHGGTLNSLSSAIYNNTSDIFGGGILNNSGTARLINSIVSNNVGNGGTKGIGIFAKSAGQLVTVHLTHTTVISNGKNNIQLEILTGGTGSFVLHNSIVSGINPYSNCIFTEGVKNSIAKDVRYTMSSDSSCVTDGVDGNIVNNSPQIGSLQDNGGDTWSHLPESGSPVIDTIPLLSCPLTTDQRGVTRPQGGSCDMGSVEQSAVMPTLNISFTIPSTITLDWELDSANSQYDLYRHTSPYSNHTLLAADVTPQVEYTDDGTNYYFFVRAIAANGDTADSNEVGVFHFELTPGE